jgi:hypothetical protein
MFSIALFGREQRVLFRVGGNGDDNLVEQLHGAAHEIRMAVGHGVERSGVDGGNFHGRSCLPGKYNTGNRGLMIGAWDAPCLHPNGAVA